MRLAKGAKETFGWVVVGADREIIIPPGAWERYGFQAGEKAVFIPGSRTSGGFGLASQNMLAGLAIPIAQNRIQGYGRFSAKREVRLPESIPAYPGDRLLSVFGSGHALGFISRGPIYEEALRHPELDEFKKECE
jgi:hypothetical protein